jgi:uncharacterized protein (TIGR02172 family)
LSSLNIKANDSSEYAVVSLEGRIDSTNSDQFEKDLFAITAASQKDISFDAEKLEYISSAGLRVLLKLQKTKSRPISVFNVSRDVYDIFETTGFTQLFDIKKQYREISVDGCEIIGKGYYGTVYRLDEDTVVKKYESPEAISIIENEKRLARLAFVAGIPTAISFDIVKIGNSYGSVFELLKAKTFHDLIKEKPNEIDSIISDYTELIKKVHSISMEPGTLPSCKEMFLNKLENIRSIISEKLYEGMKNFYTELPEDNHVVHGDIQMKNVMLSGDEPMLIDMDTLSQGLPLFDFGGLYLAYIAFTEDDPNNSMEFFGIDTELCNSIFNKVFDKYYKDIDESERKEILTKIRVIGYTSFLNMLESRKDNELAALQIKHTIEYLESVFC